MDTEFDLGQYRESTDHNTGVRMITLVNPADGQKIPQSYCYETRAEALKKLERSFNAFSKWSRLSTQERAARVLKLKSAFERNLTELANLITTEMGKPITEAEAEIKKSVALIEYFAHEGPKFIQDELIATGATKSFISFRPIGPLLGIMPWNFPLWQIVRFAIPTLVLGNTVMIKHAENTLGSSLLIEKIFAEAGLGEDVYQNLVISIEDVGHLIDDPRVRGVSLTGSVRAGKAVGSRAGMALKKTVLELGGSDAYIILSDANLDEAVQACVNGRFVNSGQSCVAAKRFIAVASVFEKFEAQILEKVKALKLGNPLDRATQIGPIARKDLLEQLEDQIERSVKAGAKRLLGGHRISPPGFFYAPTVLTNVTPDNPAFKEEIFGPVCALIRAENDEHALILANDSQFGLGGAIFSQNTTRAMELAARDFDTGSVFINDFVKSNPMLPFGGVRNSGVGREMSRYGMLEFANVKTIYLK